MQRGRRSCAPLMEALGGPATPSQCGHCARTVGFLRAPARRPFAEREQPQPPGPSRQCHASPLGAER
eukprot:457945-Heterocapsa_arctica.AAC.1